MDFRKYRKQRWWRHSLSAPIIYSFLWPIIFVDIWSEVYHRICFPLYGLPYVKRKNYIRIDRHKLKTLNLIQKINCMYCGYVNGYINYLKEIGARTEQYWCSIKHETPEGFVEPEHHKNFIPRDRL
ncbi:MAG: hypothetical protein C0596_10105 [Marinilabiliales bacterium]|nr:MAG: hypothetical protein C0596_10105 [Marinilabiliales bacterium]